MKAQTELIQDSKSDTSEEKLISSSEAFESKHDEVTQELIKL